MLWYSIVTSDVQLCTRILSRLFHPGPNSNAQLYWNGKPSNSSARQGQQLLEAFPLAFPITQKGMQPSHLQ